MKQDLYLMPVIKTNSKQLKMDYTLKCKTWSRKTALNALGYGDIYNAVQKRVNAILLGR